MKLEAEKVKLFPGTVKMIKDLRARNLELYILSRNKADLIKHVLERYGLQDDLRILDRRKRYFGRKSAVITRLIQQKGYKKESVWMIGDEVRDIQAAKRAGINSIAVSWGLQDTSILELCEPTHLVSTIDRLHKLLRT